MPKFAVTLTISHTQYVRADTEAEAVALAQDSLPDNVDTHALTHYDGADVHWDADRLYQEGNES